MPSDSRPRDPGSDPAAYALIRSALVAARRDLVSEHWHKGASAIDANGRETEPGASESVAWCAQGALLRHLLEGDNATIRAAIQLLHQTAHTLSDGRHETLFSFNDAPTTSLADIDQLLALAIAEATRSATGGADLRNGD